MKIIKDRAIVDAEPAQPYASSTQPGEISLDAPLIAIEIPKFTDGRAYSLARILRRSGFRGELRAVGYVLRDDLIALERCGFNAFELHPGKSLESALEAFEELSVIYQATAGDPRPLYRRRVD